MRSLRIRVRLKMMGLLLSVIGLVLLGSLPAQALPAGNAITNSNAILRHALPITEPQLLTLDDALSRIGPDLKYNRWSVVQNDIHQANQLLEQTARLLTKLPPETQTKAQASLTQLQQQLAALAPQVALKIKAKDKTQSLYTESLATLTQLEQNWLGSYPFTVPAEYSKLPRLLGRAEVALETTAGTMTITLDGYSAPVTAGNFADLVQKGFYDQMDFSRVEDFYVIQAGDPPGPADGYVDPKTKQIRKIPLEIRVKNETAPRYGKTFEELGIWDAEPMLTFSAKGTVAMARYPDEPNSASSQFFIFIAEPDLTPAGLNLMDGRFAVFGYITDGINVMTQLKKGDKIIKARLISGSENLKA